MMYRYLRLIKLQGNVDNTGVRVCENVHTQKYKYTI